MTEEDRSNRSRILRKDRAERQRIPVHTEWISPPSGPLVGWGRVGWGLHATDP